MMIRDVNRSTRLSSGQYFLCVLSKLKESVAIRNVMCRYVGMYLRGRAAGTHFIEAL
jgi:hypothetical protein